MKPSTIQCCREALGLARAQAIAATNPSINTQTEVEYWTQRAFDYAAALADLQQFDPWQSLRELQAELEAAKPWEPTSPDELARLEKARAEGRQMARAALHDFAASISRNPASAAKEE